MQISLDVVNKRSLEESLDFYCQGELMEGDNQYFCEEVGRKVALIALLTLNTYSACGAAQGPCAAIVVQMMRRTCILHLNACSKCVCAHAGGCSEEELHQGAAAHAGRSPEAL